jgi:hypothetical protein
MTAAPVVRRGLAVLAALLVLATAATVVFAAETSLLDGKLRFGDAITVGSDETVDGNLYLFAGTVVVDGTVEGDLTAFGGQVTVNGTVNGDLLVGGGSVTVNGDVEGDVRIGGGQVALNGGIAEDVLVSGGQVTVGGTVGGDAIASGGTLTLSGTVDGSIEGTAANYTRTGSVGGSENVRIATDDRGGEDAPAPETVGDRVADALRHFAVLLIIGGLLLWLMPRVIHGPAEEVRTRPLLSLGAGFLAMIGFVVFVVALVLVAIVLAIVLGLVQLGALAAVVIVGAVLTLFATTFLFWVAVAFLADIVVGYALARLVAPADRAGANPWRELGLVAAGLAVVVIVTSLPIVGGIAKLLVTLVGLGALVVAAWRSWRGRGRPKVAAPIGPVSEAPPPTV